MLERKGGSVLFWVSLFVGIGGGVVSADNQVPACPALIGCTNATVAVLHLAENAELAVCGDAFAVADNQCIEFLPGMAGTSTVDRVASLPAPPGSIVTAAIGFLCVSLVRDRRAWLTMFASLLSLTHGDSAGISRASSHCPEGELVVGRVSTFQGAHGSAYRGIRSAVCGCYVAGRLFRESDRPGSVVGVSPFPRLFAGIEPFVGLGTASSFVPMARLILAQLARGPPTVPQRTL